MNINDLSLRGDEDTGVTLECGEGVCGGPVAYLPGITPNTYPEDLVPTANGIVHLLALGVRHIRTEHTLTPLEADDFDTIEEANGLGSILGLGPVTDQHERTGSVTFDAATTPGLMRVLEEIRDRLPAAGHLPVHAWGYRVGSGERPSEYALDRARQFLDGRGGNDWSTDQFPDRARQMAREVLDVGARWRAYDRSHTSGAYSTGEVVAWGYVLGSDVRPSEIAVAAAKDFLARIRVEDSAYPVMMKTAAEEIVRVDRQCRGADPAGPPVTWPAGPYPDSPTFEGGPT